MTLNASQRLGHLYNKRYDKKTYHCAHLVVDVLEIELGVNLSGLLLPVLDKREGVRQILPEWRERFKRIKTPEEKSIIIFRAADKSTHAGVFLRGRVIHLKEHGGVECVDLSVAALGFRSMRVYKWLG